MKNEQPNKKRINSMKNEQPGKKRINPFKLFYFRRAAGFSLATLAQKASISLDELIRIEQGSTSSLGKFQSVDDFAELEEETLYLIEAVLNCQGSLRGGQEDDFATQLVHYYEINMPGNEQLGVIIDDSESPKVIPPKAIVFDFDGTLTKPNTNRTTWETLWIHLGYSINECGMLAQRFFRNEIDHDQWCRLTLEKFRSKRLHRDDVLSIGRAINLIDGFETAIEQISQKDIPMYIVSGSIWDIVISALGNYYQYFKRIEANVFSYTSEGVIANIVGTRYDFEGKAEFIKMVSDELHIPTSQILFVGNSINDERVKASGARTLLVNPHYTSPAGQWDQFIPHMENLEEILPVLGISISSQHDQIEKISKADSAIELLDKISSIDLNEYTVVGGYRRYNSSVRAQLLDLCQRITTSLHEKSIGRQNYLICAAPGSGKTYLIQEIAKSISSKIKFVQIDLSKDSEDTVRSKLAPIGCGKDSYLCMIDEIDGRVNEQWPYDVIYKKLDVNDDTTFQGTTVFVLIGSSGGNPKRLINEIMPRYKAKDLIDRIPQNAKYLIQIPSLDLEDGICVYISKVLEAAAKVGLTITHVEKMAIFHAAMTLISSPRQIKMLADHAVSRVKESGNSLLYDHHFEPGNTDNKHFWEENKKAVNVLNPGYIKIKK